jgi:predicted Rossmann fold nucleotide-binding protein DprA/Smf involved in DNA uptake
MSVTRLTLSHPAYPAALREWPAGHAPDLDAWGDLSLLQRPLLALLGSVRCPAALILQAHDLAQDLAHAVQTLVGGFHTPVEREVLTVLLRGQAPVVICPARAIDGMRLPQAYRTPLTKGRLLLLSPFTHAERRITAGTAALRNRLVIGIAQSILVIYAAPGGTTEALCHTALEQGKTLYALEHPANAHLMATGAMGWRDEG